MTSLDIPEPVAKASVQFGDQVAWWTTYDGKRHIADGFGSTGHGETWEDAYASLLAARGIRLKAAAAVQDHLLAGEWDCGPTINAAATATLLLIVVVAGWLVAFGICR